MATTLEQVEQALGRDKLTVLAAAIDTVMAAQNSLRAGIDIDQQLETVDVAELAQSHGVSLETLRRNISEIMGPSAVFRMGKKWVIRKQKLLEFYQRKEGAVE